MDYSDRTQTATDAMDCIDMQCGLAHVAGNRRLLQRLLADFYRDHQHDHQKIRDALDKKRWDEARRLVHTIKGIAGTIGANALYTEANSLETAIAEPTSQNLQGAMDDFTARFNDLMNCLSGCKEHSPD